MPFIYKDTRGANMFKKSLIFFAGISGGPDRLAA
jgi:hypothetical protein